MKWPEFSLLVLGLFMYPGCSMLMLETPPSADTSPADLLVVVEQSRYPVLTDSLEQYSDDLIAEGGSVEIQTFPSSGSAESLKEMISIRGDFISGTFLVGDLPAAWYEQTAFNKQEEFPTDLFFMDLKAPWKDSDNDGKYDSHGELKLTHYLSRINGTNEELLTYFSKLHSYRTGNYSYLGGAYIFKDEDWFDTYRGSSFGLDRMYGTIRISENANETLKDDYLQKVAYEGADYVYQWIHATPTSLYISDGKSYTTLRYGEILQYNTQGRFINMFNCKGARFTQTNLGMTYLTGTDKGLAVTGSTKVGGNYYPLEFHRTLAVGSSWGNAFKSWYNYFGSSDDEWFLGMVILGDPALYIKDGKNIRTLSRNTFSQLVPPDDDSISLMGENLILFDDLYIE